MHPDNKMLSIPYFHESSQFKRHKLEKIATPRETINKKLWKQLDPHIPRKISQSSCSVFPYKRLTLLPATRLT